MSVQIEKSALLSCVAFSLYQFSKLNKTIIAYSEKMEEEFSQKRLFERGQKGVFGLYSGLQKLNEKVAQKGDNSDLISFMAHFLDFAQTHFSAKK